MYLEIFELENWWVVPGRCSSFEARWICEIFHNQFILSSYRWKTVGYLAYRIWLKRMNMLTMVCVTGLAGSLQPLISME